MVPVQQTVTRQPSDEGGPPGNCFAACIASLLEISIDEVPQPTVEDRTDWSRPGGYWERIAKFLNSRGLHMVEFDRDLSGGLTESTTEGYLPTFDFHWIATGLSPRGDFMHSVVCRGMEIVNDPHPDGGGLEGKIVKAAYLVPLDPASYGRAGQG